jgi:hypothetical protein
MMRTILHILTKTGDDLAAKVIATQQTQSENQVEIVDLTAATPDYVQLLHKIYQSDSVQTW